MRGRVHRSVVAWPLLIVGDLDVRKLPLTAAEDLLEIIMRRYARASVYSHWSSARLITLCSIENLSWPKANGRLATCKRCRNGVNSLLSHPRYGRPSVSTLDLNRVVLCTLKICHMKTDDPLFANSWRHSFRSLNDASN
jgi:hypothetical protein